MSDIKSASRHKKAITNLRIRPELKRAAEAAAKDDNRTLTSLIEWLIADHCRRTGRQIESSQ